MSKKIRVLVHGTGFAGQGHAEAFRYANAEIVGIVGRTESVVKQVAKDLNIPYAGTNWLQALEVCNPEVVSIATPGGAHVEPIKQAIEFGCHIFCDKPLTTNGETSKELYELAKAKEGLTERVKSALEDKVEEVKVTDRLTDSPACLVVAADDMNAQMRRMMEAAGQELPASKPILELNPEHLLIVRLESEADEDRFADLSSVIFDQASLAEGGQLEDPAAFVSRLNKLLLRMGG